MPRRKCNQKDEPLVYNSLDELLALLAAERQKTLKSRRNAQIGLGIYLAVLILFLIIGAATGFKHFGGMGGMFGGVGAMAASMYAATQTQKKGVQALAQFEDTRTVPRLIEMLEYNDKDLKMDAASLLQNLLPRLQASDACMLSPEHHAILNRLLAGKIGLPPQPGVALALVVLRAMEQIGDASSLPVVEQLAQGKGLAHNLMGHEAGLLRQAAQECLPALQVRAENQKQTQTLLRASSGNQTSPDTLLRPVTNTGSTTSADELLRVAPVEQDASAIAEVQTPPYPQTLIPEQREESQSVPLRSS